MAVAMASANFLLQSKSKVLESQSFTFGSDATPVHILYQKTKRRYISANYTLKFLINGFVDQVCGSNSLLSSIDNVGYTLFVSLDLAIFFIFLCIIYSFSGKIFNFLLGFVYKLYNIHIHVVVQVAYLRIFISMCCI